jgi:hypothetical protein
MNKAKRLTGAAGMLAAALAALILTGCDFLKNPEYADSIPLALPLARITGTDSDTGIFVGAHSYTLEWIRPNGRLFPNADYPLDSPENIEALNDALDVWMEYETLADPLPGYKKPGEGKTTSGVFSGGKLDNRYAAISANGRLILPRYWPRSYLDRPVPVTPTIETWMSNHEQRATDFQHAVQAIQDLIEDIKASPLYGLVDPEAGFAPLKTLQARMEAYIAYPDTELHDRTEFDIPPGGNGAGFVDSTKSGPLFEYYFGFIPPNDGTWYLNAGGPFAF